MADVGKVRNVLFLDDNAERLKHAFEIHRNDKLFRVETAEHCILTFSLEKHWDIVSLDHDLGGEVYVDSGREDCGMEVVRFLETNFIPITNIVIHSWNIPAAYLMAYKLNHMGYNVVRRPFTV